MENNQSPQEQGPIVKPEIKKLSMISYAYFFLSGIIVRILLNSEFLSLTENFERNTIIYISITTLVATLLISIAPHKMANNPVLSGIYSFKNDQFGELKKRISTKYSAMDLTLGNLWGNIILFFTVLLVLISFLISYSTDLGKQSFNLDYLFEKLLGIEQSVSIDNKVLLFDSNLSLTIIILLFIFLIIMFLKIHFGCKEYGRRLNLAILLGYTIEYEYGYAELLEKFLDLTKNDKRECNELYDVNWVSNYEKELGKNSVLTHLESKSH